MSDQSTPTPTPTAASGGSHAHASAGSQLRRGRIGIAGIVFFVVASAAPLIGMTGAVPVAMVLGNGAAVPGAYLAVGLTLLLFTVGYAAMSRTMTNTGAFFAYVGKGLGVNAGVASAFAAVVAYVTIQLAIYGFFGAVMGGTMASIGLDLPWYVWSFIGWALVTGLSLLSVDVGAKLLGVLLTLEVLVLLVVGIASLASGGPEGSDFAASFSPVAVFAGGFAGTAGIALAFAFASFIGFEATAIYGEESTDPKRTVPVATYVAIAVISILFAVVSFGMVTGMGAGGVIDEVLERSDGLATPEGVLFSLAEQYVGGWLIAPMAVLVLTSLFAGLLAFQNAASRYFFALGRGGVLPKRLAATNAQGAPVGGVIVTSALAALVMVIFAIAQLDPVGNLFFWMSSVTVIAIVTVEILVSIAVIRHFASRGEGGVWQTKIAPALSAVLLALGLYLLMSRFNLLAGTAPADVDPSLPESAWALNGLGWFLVLLPFIALAVGFIVSAVRPKNEQLVKDFAS
ncbi:amino acid/polyamine/organocation transporter (APC superfamily) [Microcella putealis]|uniref:Amino acid/polyamine/organocation transporter (APC superfamily) n=1 Tax=Microcella putealis TaxID=337005 RepID=A0A4Q7LTC7_9MICO|nr:APC family permease [Microcella putealis]RZS57527.1 amino acid/polyamine/organocation transporter (APC superfamily) [Microcella putealis]TQM24594.1 amino acid/polyamine/organocation transporter (APC superfamily) [Microcella putealis]